MSSFPPWRHSPYDVTLSGGGGWGFPGEANIWLTGHVTPCCMQIGPFVPRDLYLALWLVSAQVTPLTTYIPNIISKCCLVQSQHCYQKDLYNVKKGSTNINFLLIFFLLASFVFLVSIRIIPYDGKGKHDCLEAAAEWSFMVKWVCWLEWIQNLVPSQQVEEED